MTMSIVVSHGGPKTLERKRRRAEVRVIRARHEKTHARRDRTETADDEPFRPERVQHSIALKREGVAVFAVVVRVLADLDVRALHERPQEHHTTLSRDRMKHRRIRCRQRHATSLNGTGRRPSTCAAAS
jgi:prolyl-tRNA editing enzyme YbaK/EbsC (Cys-tRNA(Pro) deacylase)